MPFQSTFERLLGGAKRINFWRCQFHPEMCQSRSQFFPYDGESNDKIHKKIHSLVNWRNQLSYRLTTRTLTCMGIIHETCQILDTPFWVIQSGRGRKQIFLNSVTICFSNVTSMFIEMDYFQPIHLYLPSMKTVESLLLLKKGRWLDLNRKSLAKEAAALPIVTQPLFTLFSFRDLLISRYLCSNEDISQITNKWDSDWLG